MASRIIATRAFLLKLLVETVAETLSPAQEYRLCCKIVLFPRHCFLVWALFHTAVPPELFLNYSINVLLVQDKL